MGTMVRAAIRSGLRSGRAALGTSPFSVFAGWIVRAIGVVTVLALGTESILGGTIALVAFGAYVGTGFDGLYRWVTRRVHLEGASEFALRVVGYPAGALAIVGAFTLLGTVDPTGTFTGVLASNSPAMATLFEGLETGPLGLLVLAVGGLLLVEGGTLLVRRVALSRADGYVGIGEPSGLVSLTGTVVADPTDRTEDLDVDLAVSYDDYGSENGESTTGRPPVSRVGTEGDGRGAVADPGSTDDDRFATDGGRPAAATDGAGENDRELLALAAYDADDPVVVDADSGDVVATRRDCHPEEWIDTVVTHLVEEFHAEHGVDLREDRETLHRLRIVAKRVREDLQDRTETELLLPFVAEVPGDGAVHLRRTLRVVPPADGADSRPPFETVGTVPDEDGGVDEDDDGTALATFDPADETGRPVEEPADETVVEVAPPARTRTIQSPHSGTDCVGYAYRRRTNRVRTVEVADRTVAIPGRRLDAFERDLVPFHLETFGTTVRVDPEAPTVVLGTEPVDSPDTDVVQEGTLDPDDTATVVGYLEPADDGEGEYVIRSGPPGGVLVSGWTPDELAGRFTVGALARVVAGLALVGVGASLSPVVGVTSAVGAAGGLVALGVGVAGAVAAVGFLPDDVRSTLEDAAATVRDRLE